MQKRLLITIGIILLIVATISIIFFVIPEPQPQMALASAGCSPSSVDYNPSLSTVNDCAVWQFHEEFQSGCQWFVYRYQLPEFSNLIMTEEQYRAVAPEECWKETECTFLSDCSGNLPNCQDDLTCDFSCLGNECVLVDESPFFRFQNNQCSEINLLPSQVTENDFNTLEECQGDEEEPFPTGIVIGVIIAILLIGGIIFTVVRLRR